MYIDIDIDTYTYIDTYIDIYRYVYVCVRVNVCIIYVGIFDHNHTPQLSFQKLCRDLKAAYKCMGNKATEILPIEKEQRAKLKWGCYNASEVTK